MTDTDTNTLIILTLLFSHYSVSGQLSETFRLLIKSQPIFIAWTSGLLHSIPHCLVTLGTEFQFHDILRH